MKQFSYVLTNEQALHQKTMSLLAQEASRFRSDIQLEVDGKSVALGGERARALLRAQCGDCVTVIVEGKDEEAAVAAIQNYFVANM